MTSSPAVLCFASSFGHFDASPFFLSVFSSVFFLAPPLHSHPKASYDAAAECNSLRSTVGEYAMQTGLVQQSRPSADARDTRFAVCSMPPPGFRTPKQHYTRGEKRHIHTPHEERADVRHDGRILWGLRAETSPVRVPHSLLVLPPHSLFGQEQSDCHSTEEVGVFAPPNFRDRLRTHSFRELTRRHFFDVPISKFIHGVG